MKLCLRDYHREKPLIEKVYKTDNIALVRIAGRLEFEGFLQQSDQARI